MSEGSTPIGILTPWRRAAAWLTGAALGAVAGISLGLLVQSLPAGLVIGLLTGLLFGSSLQRWLCNVAAGAASIVPRYERRMSETNWPGFIGLGAGGRDNGRA